MYEAARITDQIKHSGATVGTAIGTLAGVAALIPGPWSVVAVVVAIAAPILGGLIHYNAGPITTGAKRVFVGGRAAARAMVDVVGCDAPKVIAQGSRTVAIENYPAARIDDQTQCGGSIGEGCQTVCIGREPATYVHVDSEVPLWLQIAYIAAGFSGLAAGGIEAILGAGELETVEALAAEGEVLTEEGEALAEEGEALVEEGEVLAKEGAEGVEESEGIDSNKLHHIFDKPEHELDDFVNAQGGQEQAFRAIQDAANEALRTGEIVPGPNGILPGGDSGPIINVNGTDIRLVGGRVTDDVVQIATASRKGL